MTRNTQRSDWKTRSAVIEGAGEVVSVSTDILEAFAETVHRYPDRSAVVHNGRALSYLRLYTLVTETALSLGSRSTVVGVPVTRSPDTIAGLLGVLAAGGTYCPIDPTFPFQRRQTMLEAAGCHRMFADEFDPSSVAVSKLGRGANSVPTAPDQLPAFDSELPAYILFTSGSTGDPKPVVTPRGAIATTVQSLRDLFDLTPADRVLQFASLNWDTCFEEILPTLTTGAALVIDDEAHKGSFPRFLRMIEREQVTVLNLPTAYWHELVRHLTDAEAGLPGCVRTMVIGGEAVNPAALADWCDLDTAGIRLVNTYGCTETTLITHAVDLHGPRAPHFDVPWREVERVPIGWPLPHVDERVTDDGELLIGGPALALGYRGLPEATEARFPTVHGERYFRTGDRVRRSPDGMLVPAGRLDHEVKVRGIRVDPSEVEAHIAGHPGVSAVAVVGARVAGRTALLGYVVARPDVAAESLHTDVLGYLRTRVPSHLVPSRITIVPELVHTTSGKVDRAGTHQRHGAPDPASRPTPAAPRTTSSEPPHPAARLAVEAKESPDER